MLRRLLFGLSLATLLGISFIPTDAQSDSDTVIQIAIPQFYKDLFQDTIIPAFEAMNPDITVEIVLSEAFGGLATSDDIEEDLDNAAETFSKADIVLVDRSLTPEFTRTGYLLDLSPLVSTDTTFNADEFYPSALESFRWDNGLWALPVGVDVILAFYQPQAFDAAGLAYPSASWTVDDWANAIRALTEFDGEGKSTKIAFDAFEGFGATFLSLIGGSLIDESVFPSLPNLDSPAVAAAIQALADLYEGGYFEVTSTEGMSVAIGGPNGTDAFEGTPLVHGRSSFAGFRAGNGAMAAELPGGAIMTAQGFAVSAGTRHPEAAYAFAKFLTNSPEAASLFFGTKPARRTVGAPADDGRGNGGGRFAIDMGNEQLAPEAQAVIDNAFETARPMRDLHFTDALENLATQVSQEGISPEIALQEQELVYLTRLQAAEARRATPIVVNTPRSQITLAEGEIALNIGIGSGISPMPNQADWDALAAEFAAQDAQVGVVFVEGTVPFDLSEMNQSYDCFVTTNGLTDNPDFSQIRNLDPLMQSDPNFVPNDLLGGILAGLQKDGMTWAYPLTIAPEALRYNPTIFSQAGVPEPVNGWTVSEFEDALRQISAFNGSPAFVPGFGSTSYIMILAAAYGGNPIDTRTDPASIDYDDPATVAALQQLLDLAIAGGLDYQNLAGAPGAIRFGGSDSPLSPATVSGLNGIGFGGGGIMVIGATGPSGDGFEAPEDPTRLVSYPRGSTLNGVSYSTTAGYIGSNTPHVDACYRFLSYLQNHLDIIGGMPAYRSQLNNPAVIAQNGESSADFFADYEALLDAPNTITVGQLQFGFGESYWLQRTLDEYVASGGELDLAAALTEAETFTNEYRACAATVPPIDFQTGDFRAYADALGACATSVDSTADFGF
jgi:multiple sugar transport system substrate-binding protein